MSATLTTDVIPLPDCTGAAQYRNSSSIFITVINYYQSPIYSLRPAPIPLISDLFSPPDPDSDYLPVAVCVYEYVGTFTAELASATLRASHLSQSRYG